jgi:Mn2+/Fe2+ NRAMP family transporter
MTSSHMSRKITAGLAIAFLLPALIFFIMWSTIGLRVSGINEQEKMATYIGYFPAWLQNIRTIHVVSIICCIMAIILAGRSFSKNLLSVRVLMFLTVVAAFFILLFDIYQMVY